MWIVFDTTKEGMETLMKPWQVEILKFAWQRGGKGFTSREVSTGTYKISRASVINFLNALTEKGVLNCEQRTGKGGYHGFYTPKYNEEEFRLLVARTIISKLYQTFPEAVREVLKGSLI